MQDAMNRFPEFFTTANRVAEPPDSTVVESSSSRLCRWWLPPAGSYS
jgi:hypothetical protein